MKRLKRCAEQLNYSNDGKLLKKVADVYIEQENNDNITLNNNLKESANYFKHNYSEYVNCEKDEVTIGNKDID